MIIKTHNEIVEFITQSHNQHQTVTTEKVTMTTLNEMQTHILTEKDTAVLNYTNQFDQVKLTPQQLKVSSTEIQTAHEQIAPQLLDVLTRAKQNIEIFHRHQIPKNWSQSPQSGVTYGMRYTPIERVCLYVPGGLAPYPSTVLMDAIPAQLAGVKELIITTPPKQDGTIAPEILVAASLCGVTDIYKVGGAQAIFAVAYGTESIPKVDKIVGPGNTYVNLAKQMVYGKVDIDKPAGPSDVLVIIEESRYAPYAAAEMLAQLEHDPLAMAITLSTQNDVLTAIQAELNSQVKTLSRQNIIKQALKNSALLLAPNQVQLIHYANQIAAEHLVLLVDDYHPLFKAIHHAGAIFCGPYTPVTLGDYYAGPNHVLPTGGTARFASPLSVMDFMKHSTHLNYDQGALKKAQDSLQTLTEMEGFTAHYNAVQRRLNKPE